MDPVDHLSLPNELCYLLLLQRVKDNPEETWDTGLPQYVAKLLRIELSTAVELIQEFLSEYSHLTLP